jgi:hypothetical protein
MALREAANEVYERIAEDDAVRYAIGAMQPIDPEYTKNTYAESGRVQARLSEGYEVVDRTVEYAHQGSVTSDTHIRAHSDIDLVVVEKKFVYLQHPLQPSSPYRGDAKQDLLELRNCAEKTLTAAYPAAKVECSGGKAISMSGGSLRRKIDVVIAAWLETPEYKEGHGDHYRGVSVLDKVLGSTVNNKPFLHNHRLSERDTEVRGGLRKAIRLLKSLKYDSDVGVSVSSYDIAALAYAAPGDWWAVPWQGELQIVEKADRWLAHVDADRSFAETLEVPNGTRKIFCEGGATFTGLGELHREVVSLRKDIEAGLVRSFRRLQEARIGY